MLCLASWYPNKNNPTLGNFVEDHVMALKKQYDVSVFFLTTTKQVSRLTLEKEKGEHLDIYKLYLPPSKSVFGKIRNYIKAYRFLFKHVQSPVDLAHVHVAFPAGLFALFLKTVYKIPFVITEHWTGYLPENGRFNKLGALQRYWHRLIFKHSSDTMVVSSTLGEAIVGQGFLSSYKVIPNPVDEKVFFPISEDKSLNSYHFIHISTCDDAQKNYTGILRAFHEAKILEPHITLTLVTENDPSEIREMIKKLGINSNNISIFGRQPKKELAKLLQSADCLVLFSNYETFSIVLAEAWMCGKPCIYSKCGGLTEIKDNRLGIQILPKDETALVKAFSDMSHRSHETDYIRNFALKQFTAEKLLAVTKQAYEITSQKRP